MPTGSEHSLRRRIRPYRIRAWKREKSEPETRRQKTGYVLGLIGLGVILHLPLSDYGLIWLVDLSPDVIFALHIVSAIPCLVLGVVFAKRKAVAISGLIVFGLWTAFAIADWAEGPKGVNDMHIRDRPFEPYIDDI